MILIYTYNMYRIIWILLNILPLLCTSAQMGRERSAIGFQQDAAFADNWYDNGHRNFNCLPKITTQALLQSPALVGLHIWRSFSCISVAFHGLSLLFQSSNADVAPAVDHAQVYTPFMERVRSLTSTIERHQHSTSWHHGPSQWLPCL